MSLCLCSVSSGHTIRRMNNNSFNLKCIPGQELCGNSDISARVVAIGPDKPRRQCRETEKLLLLESNNARWFGSCNATCKTAVAPKEVEYPFPSRSCISVHGLKGARVTCAHKCGTVSMSESPARAKDRCLSCEIFCGMQGYSCMRLPTVKCRLLCNMRRC